MSGFAGIYFRTLDRSASLPIEKMVASLKHRGPDGIHVWQEEEVGLGQCTLNTGVYSGPAAGLQTTTGRFVGVGDVRIDNRPDVISKLELRGDSGELSDVALAVLLVEQYGDSAPELIDGDFAFAVYDRKDRRLICARDHFGTRPIYWYCDNDVLIFGSEIKAILSTGLVQETIDTQKVEDFLVGLQASIS